ncbi:unnamed protein product, partial [Iphiclides podalirius]
MHRKECTVSGALGWALRLSQMTGLSPIRLMSHTGGLTVRYSPQRDNIGRVLYGSLGVIVERNSVRIAIHALWCTLHSLNMLILVEPCHRTYTEMQMTQTYVTRIMYCNAPMGGSSPLGNELEMFFRLVVSNNPSYSPLQVYTFDRLFLVKMIAGIVSYLVIALQFEVKG